MYLPQPNIELLTILYSAFVFAFVIAIIIMSYDRYIFNKKYGEEK